MNWRRKFFISYCLVGLVGVAFVEFQNLFILEAPWQRIVKYNLPFVLLQFILFAIAYYLYTLKHLKKVYQSKTNELSQSEKKEYFTILVLFPSRLFRFSILFIFFLALSFHFYEIIFLEQITQTFLIGLFFSLLRELSLGMIVTIMVVAAAKRIIRPSIMELSISTIEKVQLPLSQKIYYIFFSLLFIFLTDIVWIVINENGSVEQLIVKVAVTLGLLSIFAIFTIKLTVLDSIELINQTVKQLSINRVNKREAIRSTIPIESSDEISLLIGGFNMLQEKVGELYNEIDEELNLAYSVQQKLLPQQIRLIDKYVIEGLTIPVKDVGGDFFDIIPIDKKKMAILIGDVSGKGIPAALLVSVMLGIVRGKIQSIPSSPARLLSEINHVLMPLLADGMYVTAGIGMIDVEENCFVYASAGHVPPLIKKNDILSFLEISSFPLGMVEDEMYEEIVLPLDTLDGCVFYTDGMIEQLDKEKGMLGFDGLYRLFSTTWNQDMQAMMSRFQKKITNDHYVDDMTIVQLKINEIQVIDMKINSELGEEKKVIEQLEEQLSKHGFLEEDCKEFMTALAEVCSNAIEHGNRENFHKEVAVTVYLKGNIIHGKVFDEGNGFALTEKKDSDRGWGLPIIQQFVDQWTMYQEINRQRRFCFHIRKKLGMG